MIAFHHDAGKKKKDRRQKEYAVAKTARLSNDRTHRQSTADNSKKQKDQTFSPLRVHFTALFSKFFLKKETFLKPLFKFSFLQVLLYNLLDFLPEVLAYLAHTDIFSYRHHNAGNFLSFSSFAGIPVLNML